MHLSWIHLEDRLERPSVSELSQDGKTVSFTLSQDSRLVSQDRTVSGHFSLITGHHEWHRDVQQRILGASWVPQKLFERVTHTLM